MLRVQGDAVRIGRRNYSEKWIPKKDCAVTYAKTLTWALGVCSAQPWLESMKTNSENVNSDFPLFSQMAMTVHEMFLQVGKKKKKLTKDIFVVVSFCG